MLNDLLIDLLGGIDHDSISLDFRTRRELMVADWLFAFLSFVFLFRCNAAEIIFDALICGMSRSGKSKNRIFLL